MERVLQALADPTRRRLLDLLTHGEQTAGDLARRCLEISRPAVSQHLAVLREAGLVSERAEGRYRIYRLEAEPLRHLWEGWLARYQPFWGDRLAALKRAAEAERAEEEQGSGEQR